MFSWLKKLREGAVLADPPPLTIDRPSDEISSTIRGMILIEEIEAELARMKKVAAAEIEKPAAKYRIIKTDHPSAAQGYFVQTWAVEQFDWELSGRNGRGGWSYTSYLRDSVYKVPRALSWSQVPLRQTYIDWHNIGSANPFSTHEDAAEWLRKWLRPEVDETFFDENGEALP